jgi:anti-sigma factor (TIGR02949 family)
MSDCATAEDQPRANSTAAARAARAATRAWVAAAAPRLGVTEATVRRWIRSGRLNPSCREVYGSVFPYLDRELSAEQRAAVERHIAGCPGCEEHFAFDGTVLRFVRQRAPRPLMQTDLQERLLARFKGRPAPDS